VLGEVAQQALHVDLAQQRRRLAHRHRARAEVLDHQAEAGKLAGARGEPRGIGLVELDDLGISKICRATPDAASAAFMRS